MAPEVGLVIAGRYRLERPLARGGMGAVWVARHLHLDAEVAIKFLAPEVAGSADIRARFEREAKASAQLRIPNVVQVHDYGVEDGVPYLVMELLAGEDLEARLAREGRIAPAVMLELLGQVVKALGHAHAVGLVHRDLKPANIFLARQGGELVLKLVDFGIAKDVGLGLDGKATRTGTLLGSPRYMSPEQVRRSKDIDHRSDLWSLGVILFECLTGSPPFPGDEVGDLLVEICTADIPLASQVAPGLGPEMDRFFARALQRPPELRFQSAAALAAAFAEAVGAISAAALPIAPAAAAARQGSAPPAAQGVTPAGNTLAPSGSSVVEPPGRTRRAAILMAALVGALVTGVLVFALVRLTAAGADDPQDSTPAALPPAATPEPDLPQSPAPTTSVAPAPAPVESPEPEPEPEPEAPSDTAPDAPTAAPVSPPPSATAAPAAKPAPPRRAPVPSKPRRPSHDPLDRL